MRVAIIALVVSLAALGLAGFATFTALNDESAPPPPTVEASWSEAECDAARNKTSGTFEDPENIRTLAGACFRRQTPDSCAAYADMLQAIADNCP